mgnify:CR=1 FL=1
MAVELSILIYPLEYQLTPRALIYTHSIDRSNSIESKYTQNMLPEGWDLNPIGVNMGTGYSRMLSL